jgi:hypothetical protein
VGSDPLKPKKLTPFKPFGTLGVQPWGSGLGIFASFRRKNSTPDPLTEPLGSDLYFCIFASRKHKR